MQSGSRVLFLAAICAAAGATDVNSIKKAFTSFMLVPMVIDTPPPLELSVQFSSVVVNLGNKIPACSGISIPPYIYYDAKPEVLYTIAIIDPDWPSAAAPIEREFVHALLVNTQGNKLVTSTYLTPFFPISPPPGSGYHRIVILLFKQAKEIDTTTPYLQNLNRNNTNFSIKAFASTYGLGQPIAGNFFITSKNVCADDQEIGYTCTTTL